MSELVQSPVVQPVIKVIGLGGAGGNVIAHMINAGIEGVDFICANTDGQALKHCLAKTTLQFGGNITMGLGAGAKPEVGKRAAQEDRERLCELLIGADMVFVTAGMGGRTGTGAAPLVAQLAKEMGILTVAVVTKPLPSEGRKRMQIALQGIEVLSQYVDSLIIIPTEKLISELGRDITLLNAFRSANDLILAAIQGVADLITRPGLINVDFADVRTVMGEMGMATVGSGIAKGNDRAVAATEAAIKSPMLEDTDLANACGMLVNVTAGMNLSMREFDQIGCTITEFAAEDTTVVMGTVLDPTMQDEIRVTVVATGLNRARAPASIPRLVELARNSNTRKDPMSAMGEGRSDYLDIPAFLHLQTEEVKAIAIDADSVRIVAHPDVSDKSLALFVEVLSALYAGVSNDALVVSRADPIPSVPIRGRKPVDKADRKTAAGS